MTLIDAAIAIVIRDEKILICQRKDDDALGGYWEFPGGKQEDGETLHDCLHRELREEIAIRARPIAQLTTVEHQYPDATVRLHPFVCQHETGEVQHLECQDSRWIEPSRLREYQFPPANETLIAETIAFMRQRRSAAQVSALRR
jgi:mutator protein MutT